MISENFIGVWKANHVSSKAFEGKQNETSEQKHRDVKYTANLENKIMNGMVFGVVSVSTVRKEEYGSKYFGVSVIRYCAGYME